MFFILYIIGFKNTTLIHTLHNALFTQDHSSILIANNTRSFYQTPQLHTPRSLSVALNRALILWYVGASHSITSPENTPTLFVRPGCVHHRTLAASNPLIFQLFCSQFAAFERSLSSRINSDDDSKPIAN